MNHKIGTSGGPKARLLDAAEKLFAEHGFDGVSVRDITKEATANVAAVNYHFGSREGLVKAVMAKYIGPVHEERMKALAVVEKKYSPQPVPLEEILDAFVRPLVDQVGKSEKSEKLFCKILGRVFSEPGSMSRDVDSGFDMLMIRFGRALAKTVAHLTLEDAIWRLNLSIGVMIHILIHWSVPRRVMRGHDPEDDSLEEGIARFIKFASAGILEGDTGVVPPPELKEPQNFFGF